MGRVAAPELPRTGRRELAPRDAWWLPSCPEPGAGATGHVAAPELPRAPELRGVPTVSSGPTMGEVANP
jgi:hypothetical protein